MSSRPDSGVVILMVDDNPGDIRLTQEAFRDLKLSSTVNVVEDGQAALDYLSQTGDYADAERPHLILLDLSLPKIDGFEVLRVIKQDASLKSIPVAVLTSSKAERDIALSYDLHANCFITKPVDFQQLLDVVNSFEAFWFSTVKLPQASIF